MAVEPPPAPINPPAVVTNTVPDPFRKYVAITLAVLGLVTLAIGIIISIFPSIQGNANAAIEWGVALLGSGGFTIWDRQMPVTANA